MHYPINHEARGLAGRMCVRRGTSVQEYGIPAVASDALAACYERILQLAARETKEMFAVKENMIDRDPAFDLELMSIEPPSSWKNWERYDQCEDKDAFFNPRHFIDQPKLKGLVKNEPKTEVVERILEKIQRLRGWWKHLQFGLLYPKYSSVCRLELGLGRGYSNWISLYQMAIFLNEAALVRELELYQPLRKRRHGSFSLWGYAGPDADDSSHVNFTIGAPSNVAANVGSGQAGVPGLPMQNANASSGSPAHVKRSSRD